MKTKQCVIQVNGCDGHYEPGSAKCRACEVFEAEVNLGMVGMEFGQVAGLIGRENESLNAGFEDISRWGAPSECGGVVMQAYNKRVAAILDKAGLTAPQFNALLEERTDGKFAYWSGLMIQW